MMEIEQRIVNLESRMATLEARIAVAENDIINIKDILKKIDNNTTWLLRIIIGSIIGAVITMVIKGGI